MQAFCHQSGFGRSCLQAQVLEVFAKAVAHIGVLQRQLHRGLQKAFLATTVIALACILEGIDGFMSHQPFDGIGQLDLATHTLWLVADLVEDGGSQHVTARHTHARWRFLGSGLLHDLVYAHQRSACGLALDDAVALGVLERNFLNGQQRAALVLESGRHLLSLINDILDLSKIEAGKMVLEPSEFLFGDLVTQCITLMKEKAQKQAIEIAVEIDPTLGALTADERKIKQVTLNLLSNALKFTPRGGQIGIRAIRDGEWAQVCVWDSGIGISVSDQQLIFNEFQQADGSFTKKYEGAGLGLAIVRKFIELHGGRVWVESKLNMGSRFLFTLPISSPNWLGM